LRDSLEIFRELQLPIEKIRLGGGGAKSNLWRQIQADVYGQPVELIEAEGGAAFVAAILTGVGAGKWKTVEEACQKRFGLRKESSRMRKRRNCSIAISQNIKRYIRHCVLY
jgi:sugar (pentulose or hexulose) kinase